MPHHPPPIPPAPPSLTRTSKPALPTKTPTLAPLPLIVVDVATLRRERRELGRLPHPVPPPPTHTAPPPQPCRFTPHRPLPKSPLPASSSRSTVPSERSRAPQIALIAHPAIGAPSPGAPSSPNHTYDATAPSSTLPAASAITNLQRRSSRSTSQFLFALALSTT